VIAFNNRLAIVLGRSHFWDTTEFESGIVIPAKLADGVVRKTVVTSCKGIRPLSVMAMVEISSGLGHERFRENSGN
jgi:hypothetical protein